MLMGGRLSGMIYTGSSRGAGACTAGRLSLGALRLLYPASHCAGLWLFPVDRQNRLKIELVWCRLSGMIYAGSIQQRRWRLYSWQALAGGIVFEKCGYFRKQPHPTTLITFWQSLLYLHLTDFYFPFSHSGGCIIFAHVFLTHIVYIFIDSVACG